MVFPEFRFPLKYKFFVITFCTLSVTLGIFFYFADHIFTEDKKLSAIDLNLTVLRAATSEINAELKSRLDQISLLVPRVYRLSAQTPAEDPFRGLTPNLVDEVLGITFYRQDDPKKGFETVNQYQNSNLLNKKALPPDVFSEINVKHPVNLGSVKNEILILNRSTRLNHASQNSDLAILTFVIPGKLIDPQSQGVVVVADFLQDFLRSRLQQSELAQLFLITKDGLILSHALLNPTIEFASTPFPHPIVSHLAEKHFPRESFQLPVGGETYLINVSDTAFPSVYAVSQIRQSDAFRAISELMHRSGLLVLLVFFASTIVSILFASHLTSNLEQLKIAAEKIGNGDLSPRPTVNSNDEIQDLSDSFTWMAKRIKDFIFAQNEKAVAGNQVTFTHLMQNTVLIPHKIANPFFELVGHNIASSNCGGDFWDIVVRNNVITIFLGDATGHGADAAIVTSVVKSGIATLNILARDKVLPPREYLSLLNQVVHEIGNGRLLMKMVVLQLNLKTGALLISNAGHQSPLRLPVNSLNANRALADKKRKASAEVLFGRGERLGFAQKSIYENTSFQLQIGETVLLYNSSLCEAVNVEGRPWTEKDLKLVLAKSGNKPPAALKDLLVEKVTAHIGGIVPKNDITFVILKWMASATDRAQPEPDVKKEAAA